MKLGKISLKRNRTLQRPLRYTVDYAESEQRAIEHMFDLGASTPSDADAMVRCGRTARQTVDAKRNGWTL